MTCKRTLTWQVLYSWCYLFLNQLDSPLPALLCSILTYTELRPENSYVEILIQYRSPSELPHYNYTVETPIDWVFMLHETRRPEISLLTCLLCCWSLNLDWFKTEIERCTYFFNILNFRDLISMIGPRIAANEYYTNIQVAAFKKIPRENDVLGVLRKCNLSSTLYKTKKSLNKSDGEEHAYISKTCSENCKIPFLI